jgi:3-oxoacyl-[acyl-carrier protein] reductase
LKTYLVTGAASGIGAQLATALLQRGERVCATDVNPAPMESLQAFANTPEQLWIAALDVRNAAAWDSLFDQLQQRWGQLDVLVNVAGVLKPGYCHESTAADVDFHIDINTKGTIHGTRAAARLMKAQGHGHIVNMASLAGIAAIPGLSLYSASKFAVRSYTLAVAQELRDSGVKLTVICPDAVQTPMLDLQVDYEQAALTFSGGRSLSTQEVVDAILDRALTKAPLEITLPASRGFVSKLANFFPGLSVLVLGGLLRKGRRKQKQARQR